MLRLEGLILAGGKSTRMGGRHKGSLLIEEETFTERLVKELRKEAGQIWLSYGEDVHETYEETQIVRDIYPDCGPMGGLHAGLVSCSADGVMVAACDMPFLKIELFQYLRYRMEEEELRTGEALDGVVPILEGRVNPLAAIYKKSAAGVLEQQIKNNDYRIRSALQRLRILYLNLDAECELRPMLQNINTISEYQMMYREKE